MCLIDVCIHKSNTAGEIPNLFLTPECSLKSPPIYSPSPVGNHCPDFYHHRLTLSVLELYVNISYRMYFSVLCFWIHHLFCDSTMIYFIAYQYSMNLFLYIPFIVGIYSIHQIWTILEFDFIA